MDDSRFESKSHHMGYPHSVSFGERENQDPNRSYMDKPSPRRADFSQGMKRSKTGGKRSRSKSKRAPVADGEEQVDMTDFRELLAKMRRTGGIQMMAFVVGVMVAIDGLSTLASLRQDVSDTNELFPNAKDKIYT